MENTCTKFLRLIILFLWYTRYYWNSRKYCLMKIWSYMALCSIIKEGRFYSHKKLLQYFWKPRNFSPVNLSTFISLTALIILLASVPALLCRCMTYAYLNCYISYSYNYTCLPVIYYGYLQTTMPTCSLLWLPVVYCGYLHSTMHMATCSLLCRATCSCSVLCLLVVYYDYLQSTMTTCSLLWLPVVYYGYL